MALDIRKPPFPEEYLVDNRVYTDPAMHGREIEISRDGAPRTHSQVRERRLGGGRVRYAAVYPDLPAGVYTLWRDASVPAFTVTVSGTEVTTADWPA